MARACTICSHEKRSEIDKLVARSVSFRRVASQFKVGYKAVERHAANHQGAKNVILCNHKKEIEDLRAEVSQLRAALAGLKQAFESSAATAAAGESAANEAAPNVTIEARYADPLPDASAQAPASMKLSGAALGAREESKSPFRAIYGW